MCFKCIPITAYFVVSGARSAVSNVLHDGGGKEHRLLVDVSDGATAEPFGVERAKVRPVNRHGPGIDVVEPLQKSSCKAADIII
jgi:hypothetical protein